MECIEFFDAVNEKVGQFITQWCMSGNIGRSIGNFPFAKKAKAATVIQFPFRKVAICRTFGIVGCESDVLLNASAVLETETEMVYSV
jgi:hypothetical protein